MKTIQDYQKRHNHIKNYYEQQIKKNDLLLFFDSNDVISQVKRNVYQDILFKLNYDRVSENRL